MSSSSTNRHISIRIVLTLTALFLSTGSCNYIIPNADPDKIGTVHFPGFRLDRPWPGNWDGEVAPSSWSLQVNVSRDTMKWSPSYASGEPNQTTITAQLVLPPPDTPGSFVNTTDHGPSKNETISWRVTMMAFGPLNFTTAEPNDVENGTCPTSVVSRGCADFIKLRIRGSIPVMHGEWPVLRDLNSTICPALGRSGYTSRRLILSQDSFNQSSTVVQQYDQERFPDAYDTYGSGTFPVVVVWGHTGDTEGGEQLDGAGLEADHVQILCVKADSSSRAVVVNVWTAAVAILMATAWTGLFGL